MPSGVYKRTNINSGHNKGKRWKVKDVSNMKGKHWHKKECSCGRCKCERGELLGTAHPRWKNGFSRNEYRKENKETLAGRKRPEQCEVCGAFRSEKRAICFDHDHVTGKFRGWICTRCNFVVGLVKDKVEILELLIKYLQK